MQVCIISLTKAVKKDALNDNATLDPQRQTSMDNKRAEGRKLRNTQKRKNTRQCRIGLKKKKELSTLTMKRKENGGCKAKKRVALAGGQLLTTNQKKKKATFHKSLPKRTWTSADLQVLCFDFLFFFFWVKWKIQLKNGGGRSRDCLQSLAHILCCHPQPTSFRPDTTQMQTQQ